MAKKSFVEQSPVDAFITKPEELPPDQEELHGKTVPDGYKLNPLYVEKKTQRMQFVLKPSTVAKLKAAASAAGKSVNDYISCLLDDTLG